MKAKIMDSLTSRREWQPDHTSSGIVRNPEWLSTFSLTSLQIEDKPAYLSILSLHVADDSKKLIFFVDNSPWTKKMHRSKSAQLWQLMMARSRLSPYANQKEMDRVVQEIKSLEEDDVRQTSHARSQHRLERQGSMNRYRRTLKWRTLAAIVRRLQARRKAFARHRASPNGLCGCVTFEVPWGMVQGIQYTNELQVDTYMAIEVQKITKREFDSLDQAHATHRRLLEHQGAASTAQTERTGEAQLGNSSLNPHRRSASSKTFPRQASHLQSASSLRPLAQSWNSMPESSNQLQGHDAHTLNGNCAIRQSTPHPDRFLIKKSHGDPKLGEWAPAVSAAGNFGQQGLALQLPGECCALGRSVSCEQSTFLSPKETLDPNFAHASARTTATTVSGEQDACSLMTFSPNPPTDMDGHLGGKRSHAVYFAGNQASTSSDSASGPSSPFTSTDASSSPNAFGFCPGEEASVEGGSSRESWGPAQRLGRSHLQGDFDRGRPPGSIWDKIESEDEAPWSEADKTPAWSGLQDACPPRLEDGPPKNAQSRIMVVNMDEDDDCGIARSSSFSSIDSQTTSQSYSDTLEVSCEGSPRWCKQEGFPFTPVHPVAATYSNKLILFRFRDPLLPLELRRIITADQQLLKMLEWGLPPWAIFFQSYPVTSRLYRPWMRPACRYAYFAISTITLLIGFYDLYKNVPILRETLRCVLGPLGTWLGQWEFSSRLQYLGTMLVLQNLQRALRLVASYLRSLRQMCRIVLHPLQAPLAALGAALLPVCTVVKMGASSVGMLVGVVLWKLAWSIQAMAVLLWAVLSALLLPFWGLLALMFSLVWAVLHPILVGAWVFLKLPVQFVLLIWRVLRTLVLLGANFGEAAWRSLRKTASILWMARQPMARSFRVASRASPSPSTWRKLSNEIFHNVFCSLHKVFNGLLMFLLMCNRHRLSTYNYWMAQWGAMRCHLAKCIAPAQGAANSFHRRISAVVPSSPPMTQRQKVQVSRNRLAFWRNSFERRPVDMEGVDDDDSSQPQLIDCSGSCFDGVETSGRNFLGDTQPFMSTNGKIWQKED